MLVRPSLTLTYAGARLALDAALARAEELGAAFDVAVTDAGGHLMAFARMDGAFALSAGIAVDKAHTVVGFGGIPSDALYAAIRDEEDVRFGIAKRDRVAAFAGGVPLVLDGVVVGAVGASGGSAAQDRQVAEAGASALAAAVDDADPAGATPAPGAGTAGTAGADTGAPLLAGTTTGGQS